MKNSTKIVSLVVIVVIIIALFAYYKVGQAPIDESPTATTSSQAFGTTTDTTDCSLTKSCTLDFADSNKVFSYEYNSLFAASEGQSAASTEWRVNTTQTGFLLSKVTIPKSYMPGTNFSEATFTVGRSKESDALRTCSTDATNGEVKDGTRVIDRGDFTKFTLNDAGAGNFYDTTSYRGIVDGYCYALEYTIHSTNIGNYSPDQGIKEFDKAKIQSDFEKIISSFQFRILGS